MAGIAGTSLRNSRGRAAVCFSRTRENIMPILAEPEETELPELGISTEKVRFIIIKARQFDAKEGDSDPDEGSNAVDDGEADVLEDKPEDDAVRQELVQFINRLNEDEQI